MVGAPPALERMPRASSSSSGRAAAARSRAPAPAAAWRRGRRRRRALVALGERLAGGHAGGLGRLRGDPRRVRLERHPLQRGHRRSSAAARSRFAGRPPSRAAALISLISSSQSRAAASTSSRLSPPLSAARNAACAASFSRRTARGSAIAAAASARVMCSSYDALRGRAAPPPPPSPARGRGHRASLGGDAPLARRTVPSRRVGAGRSLGRRSPAHAARATPPSRGPVAFAARSCAGRSAARSPIGWTARAAGSRPRPDSRVERGRPRRSLDGHGTATSRAAAARSIGRRLDRSGVRPIGRDRRSPSAVIGRPDVARSRGARSAARTRSASAAAGRATAVRRSDRRIGRRRVLERRSAGPPRAGSASAAAKASSARVEATRRGIASVATVTRTSRGAGGRARRTSMRAAPLATPRTSRGPGRRTRSRSRCPHLLGSRSFDSTAPSPRPA